MGESRDDARLPMLVRGALVNLTNPKGLVFLLAVLPQFVVPTAPLPPQYLVIGVTMVAVDLVVMGGYAGLATRLLRLAEDAAPADRGQPDILGAVRDRRGGAVAGAPGPRRLTHSAPSSQHHVYSHRKY